MKVVLFCHSIVSDWNHGNAHFLRGLATELIVQGHDVRLLEPRDAWSAENLARDAGPAALDGYLAAYPGLHSNRFDPAAVDLDAALDGADLVLVHEWNEHALVSAIGRHHTRAHYALLFHDTHHRSVTDEASMSRYELDAYDGVLAFGEVIRERYVARGWARRAWTWHEAADVRVFAPRPAASRGGDVVWIGNWGDGERSQEIREYLVAPVASERLRARVHGVRYPAAALEELSRAGIEFGGWLPNYVVPDVFAAFRATVHIPRGPYVAALPGIPTIRVFEALACGIPLVSCAWDDCERLFQPGRDFLMVSSPEGMRVALRDVVHDAALAAELADQGRRTVLARHTCAHRAAELMDIVSAVRGGVEQAISA